MSSTTLENQSDEESTPAQPEEQREKWTISRLNFETGIDRRTLKNVLSTVKPVASDKQSVFYHLRDFVRAYRAHVSPADEDGGDLVREQARLTKIKADIAVVERARVRNEVIDTEMVFRVWENIAVAIRRTVLTSGLSDKEKDHILNELKSFDANSLLEFKDTEIPPNEA
jgi:phage terminase Nu1 subunit (DNA packaging protein)